MPQQSALELWQEKLEDLLKADALATDASERFKLKKHIEEAQERIAVLQQDRTAPNLVAASDPPAFDHEIRDIIERLFSRVAEAPEDLDDAFRTGLADVDSTVRNLGITSIDQLRITHIDSLTKTAIKHGAGIYNHESASGPIYCGRIYHNAALKLVDLDDGKDPSRYDRTRSCLTDADLAYSWLRSTVSSVPTITDANGDETAWELRFIFDATHQISVFDSIAMQLKGCFHPKADNTVATKLLDRIREDADEMQLPAAAFLLRHALEVLVVEARKEGIRNRSARAEISDLTRCVRKHDRIMREGIDSTIRALQMQIATMSLMLQYKTHLKADGFWSRWIGRK